MAISTKMYNVLIVVWSMGTRNRQDTLNFKGVCQHTETTVPIVHEHVATQGNGGVIIDAACTIGHITHDYSQRVRESESCTFS